LLQGKEIFPARILEQIIIKAAGPGEKNIIKTNG
jgi:hypothetical protein